jgi:hypothetical protein
LLPYPRRLRRMVRGGRMKRTRTQRRCKFDDIVSFIVPSRQCRGPGWPNSAMEVLR